MMMILLILLKYPKFAGEENCISICCRELRRDIFMLNLVVSSYLVAYLQRCLCEFPTISGSLRGGVTIDWCIISPAVIDHNCSNW